MAQYTFSEGVGQVNIDVARENTVIIGQSFTVEMAILPTSTARESVLELFSRHIKSIIDFKFFLLLQVLISSSHLAHYLSL